MDFQGLQPSVGTAFTFKGVHDEEVLPLGNVTVTVLHTPGHTPEHICLAVSDHTRADEPWFVFTGHALMVGDLGRTELAASAEEGARNLLRRIGRLKALPDYVEVLPGAYAFGALSAGLIADRFGFAAAITFIAALTFLSGTVVAALMRSHPENCIDPAQDNERTNSAY